MKDECSSLFCRVVIGIEIRRRKFPLREFENFFIISLIGGEMKVNKFDVQIARIRFRGLSFQQTVFQNSYTLKR